jgi:methylenetetrahydrofolate--tRNA-(uracil-5-)-methyltransferase
VNDFLTIIGAGLAGAEAAWQAAERGIKVVLYEMRPVVRNPVHKTENCAELVCSNSLGVTSHIQLRLYLKKSFEVLIL